MNTGTTGTYGTATHTAVDPVTTNTAPATTTTTTTGPHRGPIRAAEDALMGGVTGTTKTQTGAGTGAGVGTAGAGHGLAAGTGAGGMGTTGITGAHHGAHGAGVRPSAGQRIVGEAEKLVGHVVGNPTMVARGQEKKTGMPATVQNTGGVGTTNAASGPGVGGGRVL